MLKICLYKQILLVLQRNYNPTKMKIFTIALIVIALGLAVFNVTQLDFTNFASEKNKISAIGIAASFCAVLILVIFRISKMIEEKTRQQ